MKINQQIKQTPRSNEIDQRVMIVTPSLATRWLEMNNGNRPIRKNHVEHLANQMKQGRWMLSPEPIVFSKNGRLLDGQHRLNAVIQSGHQIEASVALVANEDVFRVLDQGINRSNSDILNIPTQVVTPMQFLVKIGTPVRKVTSSDLEPFINHNIGQLSAFIHEHIKPRDKRFKSATFRAAYIMAVDLGILNKDLATEVYHDLAHMEMHKWSRIMQNLFHQFETYSGNGGQQMSNPFFMRGLYMFSSIETKRTSIRLTEQFEENMASQVRARVRAVHGGKSK